MFTVSQKIKLYYADENVRNENLIPVPLVCSMKTIILGNLYKLFDFV